MTRNVAASVRVRLANHARERKRPFQGVLQYYGLERFLYRFSRTRHSGRFLLKGGLMLRVCGTPGSRPTRDIDLLGHAGNEIEALEAIARDVRETSVEDDGVRFDASAVARKRIKEGAESEGVLIRPTVFLENAHYDAARYRLW